jgi:hypothetical protein
MIAGPNLIGNFVSVLLHWLHGVDDSWGRVVSDGGVDNCGGGIGDWSMSNMGGMVGDNWSCGIGHNWAGNGDMVWDLDGGSWGMGDADDSSNASISDGDNGEEDGDFGNHDDFDEVWLETERLD